MLRKSTLKTWLKRKGFSCPIISREGYRFKMSTIPFRQCLQCGGGVFRRGGRYFRIRSNEHQISGQGEKRWTVDISGPIPAFDRWSNSTKVYAMSIEVFMKLF